LFAGRHGACLEDGVLTGMAAAIVLKASLQTASKVSEYWLCHINDVKIQCSRTVGSYGTVSEHCKIILVGALHVEIENDFNEGCSEKLAQYLADRIKVFLAK
jgi:hypothetical protein